MSAYTIITIILAQKPWIYGVFEGIRRSAISGSTKITGIAVLLGSLIVTCQLVKLAYDLMSDEQSSGFGQIDIKTILRPFLILALIQGFPVAMGAFDGIVNSITMAMVEGVDYDASARQLGAFCDTISEEKEDLSSNAYVIENAGKERKVRRKDLRKKAYDDEMAYLFNESTSTADALQYENALSEFEANLANKEKKEIRQEIRSMIRAHVKAEKKLDKASTIVGGAASWLFQTFFYVMESFAEIFLCVLAFLGPFALVMSLFFSMKDAAKHFFARYAQVSMWKVLASVIMWVVGSCRSGVFGYVDAKTTEALSNMASLGIPDDMPTALTAVLLNIILCMAGLLCLINIPSMAASIIPAPSSGSAMAGAEGLTSKGMDTAGSPAKKAGGLAKNAAKNVVQQRVQNTKAWGKITGRKNS